jgi:hypothetical protein
MNGLEKLHKGLAKEFSRSYVPIAKKHEKELGQSILNSLFDDPGPKHINRIPTPKEIYLKRIFDGFSEIHSSYQALTDIEIYINRFPFSATSVTKPRYLRYHVENYFNEMYLLKKRLLAFLTIIGRSFRKDSRHSAVLAATRPLFRIVSDSLKDVVDIRGRHVHQKRYSDTQIDRLELMELLSRDTKEDDELAMALKPFYKFEYKRIRSEWKSQIKRNNETVNKLLMIYSDNLHSILFSPENNELIYPSTI